ncbi:hypothetical protein [Vibrio sp. OPT18]|uniref:hypothetical protein n=1 Tax=Vibrio sp. OPT18 TaxID=2778641 RepID=UPI0018816979|nr:hypothetical protein [Vibrio sp. OPT18]MBE8577943.1 hypothetical protein [Vibrio sp. OPT18]
MKRSVTLAPGEEYSFNVHELGKYLIVREASNSIMIHADNMRPVEIENGDTVSVERYDVMKFRNHNATETVIKYEISDVYVHTKMQKMAVDGEVIVTEIKEPITVERVNNPVIVQSNAPLSVREAIYHRSLATRVVPVTGTTSVTSYKTSGSVRFMNLTIQADTNNQGSLILLGSTLSKPNLGGIELPPGAVVHFEKGLTEEFYLQPKDLSVLTRDEKVNLSVVVESSAVVSKESTTMQQGVEEVFVVTHLTENEVIE